jgi:hypothetical protein
MKTREKTMEGHLFIHVTHEIGFFKVMKTKSISNNVMECNVFLSMGTLEKVYPHWVNWMAIDGMGQNNIYYIGEIQLGAQC